MKKIITIVAVGLGGLLTCLTTIHFVRLKKVHDKITEELES